MNRSKEIKRVKDEIFINEKKIELHEHSMLLRGAFIQRTVEIERKIDIFLSNYFCKSKSKGNELMEMLWCTERINFSSKKDIFFIILKKHHKDFLVTYPKFAITLEKLIPHRNIFAHLEIDTSTEAVKEAAIIFKKYKGGVLVPQVYTEKEILKIAEDAKFIFECIGTL